MTVVYYRNEMRVNILKENRQKLSYIHRVEVFYIYIYIYNTITRLNAHLNQHMETYYNTVVVRPKTVQPNTGSHSDFMGNPLGHLIKYNIGRIYL